MPSAAAGAGPTVRYLSWGSHSSTASAAGGRPHAEGQPHRTARAAVQRHAEQRGQDRARGQHGQVDADEQPGPLRPAPLGHAGQEHVEDGDGARRQRRAGEQHDPGRHAAQQQARGEQDQRHQQDHFLAVAPVQPGGEGGDHAEADHRGRGEQGQRGRRQVQAGLQVGEDRRQAGDRGTQVQPGRRDRDDEQRDLVRPPRAPSLVFGHQQLKVYEVQKISWGLTGHGCPPRVPARARAGEAACRWCAGRPGPPAPWPRRSAGRCHRSARRARPW